MAVRLVTEGGRDASTFYEVLERFDGYALVKCHPKTGRTHQIRVHMASIGHPILADKAYLGRDRLTLGDLIGSDAPDADRVLLDRQALHAHALSLAHPMTGEPLSHCQFRVEPAFEGDGPAHTCLNPSFFDILEPDEDFDLRDTMTFRRAA